MWLKLFFLLLYFLVLFVLARFFEAIVWYETGIFATQLVDPVALSFKKLKTILECRGLGYSGLPEKKDVRELVEKSGDLMEGELYSALKEEEASESVSSTNFSGEMHFYELVEDTKDGIWLVQVNEWSLKIRKEMRVVDRQIRDIQREEEKVKRSVKDAAKKGQKDVCVVLAKEMIRSRKAVSKLYASKAHMNSVLMGMKNQLAVLRVAGSLQKSTEVMKAMQSLVKIPEIQATMRELSKEMMKAGIIEEMLEDTFESMDDQEEMEEEAEMEIDRILFEITAGALGKAPSKVTDALPEPEPSGAMAASEDEEEEEEALEAMQSRLATLRS
ncbi:charged multivesicular body protein 3 isoform X4 [Pongo abelii]|nr:charged multivesicular body protein 3 isoform X2 [Pongo abelii]XP_054331750.1 charged multivesicular body protein 3 isoform X4 [Pongo pygmaeus]XP_058284277.1 charged multivesicular body protein 3 isoform X5 [Hylobates moloch]